MSLPPSPSASTLEALRASPCYQEAVQTMGGYGAFQGFLEDVLEHSASLGNAPVVLALLDAGARPTTQALIKALESPEVLALHTARLLYDAGARLSQVH